MAKYIFDTFGGKRIEAQAHNGKVLIGGETIATYYKDGTCYRVRLVGASCSEDNAVWSVQKAASAAVFAHLKRIADNTPKPEPIAPVAPAIIEPVAPTHYGKPYLVGSTFTGVKRDAWANFASFYPASVSACDTYSDGTTRERRAAWVVTSLYGDGHTYLIGEPDEENSISDCEDGNGFNPYFADLDEALAAAVAACEKDFVDNFNYFGIA